MEFTSLIFPLTKNICRTCLVESDTSMFMNVQDLVEHEMNKVKIIDILVFLNCLEVLNFSIFIGFIYLISISQQVVIPRVVFDYITLLLPTTNVDVLVSEQR